MSSKNDKQTPHQSFDMNGMLDIEAEMLKDHSILNLISYGAISTTE